MAQEDLNADTPPKRRRIRIRLDTAGRTRREITRLYARLISGDIDPSVANAGQGLLNCNLRAIADEDFEARLAAIERRRGEKLISTPVVKPRNHKALTIDAVILDSTTQKT